jgi:hypothetical protein
MSKTVSEKPSYRLTRENFLKMAEGVLKPEDKGMIINKCLIAKIIADIRFEVMICSMSGMPNCNVSVPHTVIYSDEAMKEIVDIIKEKFEEDKFDVSLFENVISLDWSKEGPYGDFDDDLEDDMYDAIEQYENMHKQKTKKQHSPRKHNLKVIK